MPELAPVTRAFWPLRILRASHRGAWIAGSCSGITSRTDLLLVIMSMGVFRVCGAKQVGDEAGPAGLVARADAAAGVAVEVFVEEHVVAEMPVGLELVV